MITAIIYCIAISSDNQFDEQAMSKIIQNLPQNKIIEKETGFAFIPTTEVIHFGLPLLLVVRWFDW